MPYLYIQMPRTKSKNKISAVYCDGAKHGPYVTSLEHNAALLKLPQITNSVFAALPPPVAPRAARPLRSTSRRSSVASRCRPTPRSTVLSLYLSPHTPTATTTYIASHATVRFDTLKNIAAARTYYFAS